MTSAGGGKGSPEAGTPPLATPDAAPGVTREDRGRLANMVFLLRQNPRSVLVAALALACVLRLLWLWWPQDALIFDEAYYVNAARVIAGREVPAGAPYAGSEPGLDPNTPHPPLAKALIAASISLLGDGGIGWRLPSVLAAMVALAALFAIVQAGGGSAWLANLAVGLFAVDNLAFVHGRIGTLDMVALAPVLVGAWLGLRGRYALAGAACAIGALAKLTAVFGLLAILLLLAIDLAANLRRSRRLERSDLSPIVVVAVVYAATFAVGLWVLDLMFSTYRDPISHLQHMVAVGTSLQVDGSPTGIASYPWQWLINEVEIPYLRVAVDTAVNGTVASSEASIDFRGALNPVLIGAAPIAFLFALTRARRTGDRVALWCLTWAAANYLPYYVLVLMADRITYLYYFLPVVPAMGVAIALLLTRGRLGRTVLIGYVLCAVWAFVSYFPFKQLP